MNSKTKRFAVLTVAAAVAVGSIGVILVRHFSPESQSSLSENGPVVNTASSIAATSPNDAVQQISNAIERSAHPVVNLKVSFVDGIAIVRGTVDNSSDIAQIGVLVKQLGYARVANLVQAKKVISDRDLVRETERQLTSSPSLEGCQFGVASTDGIVSVRGTIHSDAQRDAITNIVRNVNGVREVRLDVRRSSS